MTRTHKCLALMLLFAAGARAQAAVYDAPAPDDDVIGDVRHIRTDAEDTLSALARRHNLGFEEIKLANPDVDPWLPGDGTRVVLPTRYVLPDPPREGLVLNLAEMRLFYYPPEGSRYAGHVITYPLGIGREGWDTPLGKTRITRTKDGPTWYPPESIRKEHREDGDPLPKVVSPGPDNPLGEYALYLGFPSYLLHGTDKPAGIGMRVSHGCIRLYPEDIAALYSMVDAGTPVRIVNEPYKAGWHNDRLFLEAHPPDATGEDRVDSYTPLVQSVIAATRDQPDHPVDWHRAQTIGADQTGIPTGIAGKAHAKTE